MSRTPRRVYLDFAAATPLSTPVIRAYARALKLFGNPSAPHAEGRAAREALERARTAVARCFSVKPPEIVFTSGGTESNNIAILGMAPSHVVTSTIEHSSILSACKILEARGTRVTYVAPGPDGVLDPKRVLAAVTAKTRLVTLHHVHSELGVVQPVADIGLLLRKRKKKVVFHVDAAQSPLWLDASPHTLRADLVSYDAQKVMGPKGVGILYRDFSVPLSPIMGGGTQERGVRPGTENVSGAVAAAVAFTEAMMGRKERSMRVSKLRNYLKDEIRETIPNAVVLGSMKRRVANNLFVAIPGVDGDYLAVLMDKEGIAVTPRSACLGTGGTLSVAALAVTGSRDLARGTIRFSLGPSVSALEIARAARTLASVIKLAKIGKYYGAKT